MSDYQTIRIERDERGVARLMLARAEKHNVMNAAMLSEIRRAIVELGADDTVRVVVLGADGKSFCAGADLGWMREQADKDRAGKIAESGELGLMLRELDESPKPLIGRVQGAAYGGGIGLMAVCDIVIAADTAKFALTETRLGLIPANIGSYVVRRLGEGPARRVFMNARPFDAREARHLGLVSEVVSSDALDDAVNAEIGWFLDCAPGAVTDAKRLCLHPARPANEDLMEWSAGKLADRWETEEGQEGIRCFLAREKAPWITRK